MKTSSQTMVPPSLALSGSCARAWPPVSSTTTTDNTTAWARVVSVIGHLPFQNGYVAWSAHRHEVPAPKSPPSQDDTVWAAARFGNAGQNDIVGGDKQSESR